MQFTFRTKRYSAWFAWLVGIPLIVAVITLIVFFFAFSLAFFGVAASVVALRVWWIRRKRRPYRPDVIEGEYTLIERDR